MSFRTLSLKKSYDSDEDNILDDFYIPALSKSVSYSRLTGFFTSESLAVAARGISGLIKNDGVMRLITGPELQERDIEAIRIANEDPQKIIENNILEELDTIKDKFIKDHVEALAWMLATGKLKIKIAVPVNKNGVPIKKELVKNSGIFHTKVGVLEDKDGNKLTFSGSGNETVGGWLKNTEEFKLFRAWKKDESDYARSDILKFNKFWNGKGKNIKTFSISAAVEKELVKRAPKDKNELNLIKFGDDVYKSKLSEKKEIELWDIQKKAKENWVDNEYRGILEMATGTGKTYTALGCLRELQDKEDSLIAVICTLRQHLVDQWRDSAKDFGSKGEVVRADSNNSNWKHELRDKIADVNMGDVDNLLVFTTFDSFSSKNFINIIKKSKKNLLLIADEMHAAGSSKRSNGLIEDYEYRLGLSATPERYYNEKETKKLFDYFNGTVFEFSLKDAVEKENPDTGKTYLCPYNYKLHFSELSEEELLDFHEETKKLQKLYSQAEKDEEKKEIIKRVSIKRARITKNAENKYEEFEAIIDQLKCKDKLSHTIIFCSPGQKERVKQIINKKDIKWHYFTQEIGTRQTEEYGGFSQRERVLDRLDKGELQVLIAMKCLDEGVDVPSAKRAIIMSSSGNPRQYVQRRGRVLRREKGKDFATIYDMIVLPPTFNYSNRSIGKIGKKIIKKEMRRCSEFIKGANNYLECLKKLDKIKVEKGINLTKEIYG